MSSPSPYGNGQPGRPGPQGPSPSGPEPASGGGYVFGPFAPGPPQGPGPGGPYGGPPTGQPPGQPPAGPPPRTPGKNRSLKLGLIIGALVLVLGGGTALAFAVTRRDPDATGQPSVLPNGSTAPGGGGSTAAPAAARASDAVNGYLQALSQGDAAAALAFAAAPVRGALLTDAALRDSAKRAPLTTVDVPVVDDPDATAVPATYQLGNKPVSASFAVRKVGGAWKLEKVTGIIDLSQVRQDSVPVRINGVAVSGDTVQVLPGSFALSTGLKYLDYGSKDVVTLTSPTDQVNVDSVLPKLTGSGKKAAVAAAKKRYASCLEARALMPKNCPFGGTSKYDYTERTIRWTQVGKNPFRKVKVTLDGRTAVVTIGYHVKISGDCRYQGVAYRCNGSQQNRASAFVIMTKEKLAARWL